MIVKGFYQTKASLKSDSKEIIRIIGPDLTKLSNWKTIEGKSIPEYILEGEYVLLDMAPNKEAIINDEKKQKTLKSIFAGLEDIIDEDSDEDSDVGGYEPPIKMNVKVSECDEDINVIYTPPTQLIDFGKLKSQLVIPKVKEVEIILDKINIDKLNEKHFNKFGERPFKKQTIEVKLPLELNFNIDKLKTTINLLDLDINIVIDILIKNCIFDFDKTIKKAMSDLLIEEEKTLVPFFNNETNIPKYVEKVDEKPKKKVDEKPKDQILLKEGMKALDDFFNIHK